MVKFHLSSDGVARICNAKTICPLGSDVPHFSSKTEARVFYEQQMKSSGNQFSSFSKEKFSESKVKKSNGELLEVFHGSEIDFLDFDSSFTGKGNDSYGSGFYFSTDEKTAKGYGKYLKKVQLDIRNPIVVDGKENMSLNSLVIPEEVIRTVLKKCPKMYHQPTDEDEMNPLGDYLDYFWDKDNWSKDDLEKMIDDALDNRGLDGVYLHELEAFYGEDIELFRREFSLASGWDGVEVKFEDGTSHWVAWFPEQIHILN